MNDRIYQWLTVGSICAIVCTPSLLVYGLTTNQNFFDFIPIKLFVQMGNLLFLSLFCLGWIGFRVIPSLARNYRLYRAVKLRSQVARLERMWQESL
jgi:hypothetical protein